jgi:hypothetical protein
LEHVVHLILELVYFLLNVDRLALLI